MLTHSCLDISTSDIRICLTYDNNSGTEHKFTSSQMFIKESYWLDYDHFLKNAVLAKILQNIQETFWHYRHELVNLSISIPPLKILFWTDYSLSSLFIKLAYNF